MRGRSGILHVRIDSPGWWPPRSGTRPPHTSGRRAMLYTRGSQPVMTRRPRDQEIPVLGAFLRECLEAGREDEDARRVVRIRDLFGAYWPGAPGAA